MTDAPKKRRQHYRHSDEADTKNCGWYECHADSDKDCGLRYHRDAPPASEPEEIVRLETGPVRVDGDWTGLFIRGDNALGMAAMIDADPRIHKGPAIIELLRLLRSAEEGRETPQEIAIVRRKP